MPAGSHHWSVATQAMVTLLDVVAASALGLATTSSSMVGAALGLYARVSQKVLASLLAFAAGSLISALAIELAFENARLLHERAFGVQTGWLFIGSGFAIGACTYYWATRLLERRGAAVRLPTRFREYAISRKQNEAARLIKLLSRCDLLRHLPPEGVEAILPCIRTRRLASGEILFRAGEPADALYLVADGAVEVLAASGVGPAGETQPIATLGGGEAFGEMALLTGDVRTATIRAAKPTELLEIGKPDFEQLMAHDRTLARAVQRLSQSRAISNLSSGGAQPQTWARIASSSIQSLSRSESDAMLSEAGHGAGLAIVLGNILDTIPGCLVIGAKFNGFGELSLTLITGMFIGGIPEAAASASMLRKADYRPTTIFALWSTVLVAGILAAAAGKVLIGTPDSLVAIFCQAIAGGAVLALVAHAMLPEAIHQGGSVVVLPTVAGFLFALYLTLLGGSA